jgi:hypothetical protein
MSTDASTTESLSNRFASLERQNRRLRVGLIAVVCLVGAAVLVGAQGADKAKASKNAVTLSGAAFNLVDDKGTVRASLSLDDTGRPSLQMYQADGNRMISLGDEQVGAFLTIFDNNDRRTVSLGTNYTTGTFLLLDNHYPEKSKTLIELQRNDNLAQIRIRDKAGKETIIKP